MNRFKNFIEIVVQLSSAFVFNLIEKLKSTLNKKKKQKFKSSDINSIITVNSDSKNQIISEVTKNKSSSKNKIVKLSIFTLAVVALALLALLTLKQKQESTHLSKVTEVSQWKINFDSANKNFTAAKYDESLTFATNSLAIAEKNGNDFQKISSTELLAKIYYLKGDFLKASELYIKFFTENLTVLHNPVSSEVTVKSLIGLGLLNQDLAQNQQAIDSFQLAVDLSKNRLTEGNELLPLSLAHIADAYRFAGKYEMAKTTFENSNHYFENGALKKTSENIIFKRLYANYYQDLGMYDSAEKLLLENSEEIAKLSDSGKYLKFQNEALLALVFTNKKKKKKK